MKKSLKIWVGAARGENASRRKKVDGEMKAQGKEAASSLQRREPGNPNVSPWGLGNLQYTDLKIERPPPRSTADVFRETLRRGKERRTEMDR